MSGNDSRRMPRSATAKFSKKRSVVDFLFPSPLITNATKTLPATPNIASSTSRPSFRISTSDNSILPWPAMTIVPFTGREELKFKPVTFPAAVVFGQCLDMQFSIIHLTLYVAPLVNSCLKLRIRKPSKRSVMCQNNNTCCIKLLSHCLRKHNYQYMSSSTKRVIKTTTWQAYNAKL